MENKKYYYLKLKDTFFDSDEMKILESMENGYLYSNILLKLYLKSLKLDGKLMFNEFIPYDSKMLSTITGHNIDVIEKAILVFKQLQLIEILDNGAIYMLNIQNLIGSISTEGIRKSQYREKIRLDKSKQNGTLSHKSPDIISISISNSNSISNYNNIYDELLEFLNKKFNTNKKGFKEETKNIINKELENGVTLDKLKNRIDKAPLENFDLNDALLGDDEKVFNFWNDQKIIKHTKLTAPIKMAIAKALKIYSLEEIKTYIERYNKVIKDDNYFFNYKWTLVDFLNRKDGISSFTDEGSKWISYNTNKIKNIQPKTEKRYSGITYID